MCSRNTPTGTPSAPPTTSGAMRLRSKPPRTEARLATWPSSPPNTASGAAICGGNAQAHSPIATSEKAKPESPWTKPAKAAPSATAPIISQESGIARFAHDPARRCNAASRIALSVVAGVIASGIDLHMQDRRLARASARAKAGRNSAVSSTVSPCPPKARA